LTLAESTGSLDVLCVGFATHDLLAAVSSYPPADAKTEVMDLDDQGGGPAATAAVAIARLGGRVAMVAAVGDDRRGEAILAELGREGVDVSACIRVPGAKSPLSIVIVDRSAGTRSAFSHRGSATLMPEQVPADLVARARVVLVDAMMPGAALEAARLAQEAAVPVVLDAGTMKPGVKTLLASVDYAIPPLATAVQMTGESDPGMAALSLLRKGMVAVVVTMGPDGYALASWNDGVLREGSFQVKVVDSTGAGDAFHGGFAFALARDFDVPEAARFASAVAALKCRKPGGRAGLPGLAEVQTLLSGRGDGA
jgi:sulfofructose kinase